MKMLTLKILQLSDVALDANLNRTELTQQVAEIIEHVEKLIQNLEEMNKFRSLNYDCWY